MGENPSPSGEDFSLTFNIILDTKALISNSNNKSYRYIGLH